MPFSQEQTAFMEESKNPNQDVTKAQALFEQLPDSAFADFKNNSIEENKHHWNQDYFYQIVKELEENFSKEGCAHLLAVKTYLQKEIKAKGFELEGTEKPIMDASNNIDDLNEVRDEELLVNYRPSQQLETAVEQKDKFEIQLILESNLNDKRMAIEEVLQSIIYVKQKNPTAYEAFREDKITPHYSTDKSDWNEEYFFLQQSYLNHNFAVERLIHLIDVREYLTKTGVAGFDKRKETFNPKTTRSQTKNIDSNNSSCESTNSNDVIKAVIKIGGAALIALIAFAALIR